MGAQSINALCSSQHRSVLMQLCLFCVRSHIAPVSAYCRFLRCTTSSVPLAPGQWLHLLMACCLPTDPTPFDVHHCLAIIILMLRCCGACARMRYFFTSQFAPAPEVGYSSTQRSLQHLNMQSFLR